jgi:hypothetical protein
MTKDEVLKLALELLQDYVEEYGPYEKDSGAAYTITAIKQALEQPEPSEPVGYWMGEFSKDGGATLYEVPQESAFGKKYRNIPLYTTPPKREPEPEPVMFGLDADGYFTFSVGVQTFSLDYIPQTEEDIELMKKCLLQAFASASPPKREPLDWQPIETAPKDGKKIILYYKNRNNFGRTVMGCWVTEEQANETDTDDVGLEAGWYEQIDNWDDYSQIAIHEGEPTHWMPLPKPPTAHGIGEKK